MSELKFKPVPYDIVTSASTGKMTVRGTDANAPYNANLLNRLQAIADQAYDSNLFDDNVDFGSYDLENLQKLLTQVVIRFDNDPNYYTKRDYQYLIWYLCKSLVYLDGNCTSKEEFLEVIEKLKEAIDFIQKQLDDTKESVEALNTAVADLNTRQDAIEKELQESISKLKEEITYLRDYVNAKLESLQLEIKGGEDITITDSVVDIALSEDIQVEYTTVGNVTHGDTIAKGRSLTEVLKQLLQKVIDVKVVSDSSLTVSSSSNVLFPYDQPFETTLTAVFNPVKFGPADPIWQEFEQPEINQHITVYKWIENPIGEDDIEEITKVNTKTLSIPALSAQSSIKYRVKATFESDQTKVYKSNGEASNINWTSSGERSADITLTPYHRAYIGYIDWTKYNEDTWKDELIAGIPESNELNVKLYQVSAQDIKTYQSTSDAPALFIACPSGYEFTYAEDPHLPGTNIVEQFDKYQCIVATDYIYTIYLNKATAGTVSIKNIKFEKL